MENDAYGTEKISAFVEIYNKNNCERGRLMEKAVLQRERGYVLAAYLADRGMDYVIKEDIFRLTHINYAFAVIRDGKVVGDHLKNVDKLNRLKEINPKLTTVISIGGWGAGGFSEAASTPEGRSIFADTAIELMKAHNFDGIDIDWEYPCSSAAGIASSPNDKHNFTLMLRELREKLDKLGQTDSKHYLLTIAAGAGQYFIDGTEMHIAHQYLDYVNLMTYDMRGSFEHITGHHTNLFALACEPDGISCAKAVDMFENAGVPAEKMVLGAAFYGRMWKGVDNIHSGLNQRAETTGRYTLSYTELVQSYVDKNGFKRYWDDDAKAPYLFNGDAFISYDDEESLRHKARYVKERGLAGMMFWEYSLDQTHTLIYTLYKELR